jgi:hypothetical protein
VQFPPSLPLGQGRDPTAIKNASDGRGAAWLKLFLFVYAVPTPRIHSDFWLFFWVSFVCFSASNDAGSCSYINVVQLCVDMVTCIKLEDLQCGRSV